MHKCPNCSRVIPISAKRLASWHCPFEFDNTHTPAANAIDEALRRIKELEEAVHKLAYDLQEHDEDGDF